MGIPIVAAAAFLQTQDQAQPDVLAEMMCSSVDRRNDF